PVDDDAFLHHLAPARGLLAAARAPSATAARRDEPVGAGRHAFEPERAVLVGAVLGHAVLHHDAEQPRGVGDAALLDARRDADPGDRRAARVDDAAGDVALRQV